MQYTLSWDKKAVFYSFMRCLWRSSRADDGSHFARAYFKRQWCLQTEGLVKVIAVILPVCKCRHQWALVWYTAVGFETRYMAIDAHKDSILFESAWNCWSDSHGRGRIIPTPDNVFIWHKAMISSTNEINPWNLLKWVFSHDLVREYVLLCFTVRDSRT